MKAFVVDAYDSFVHTICLYLRNLDVEVTVARLDEVAGSRDILADCPDMVVLGPGPGHPLDSGYVELIHSLQSTAMPLFGVCLGHQALGAAFGLRVRRAENVKHGKSSKIVHDGLGVFAGIEQEFDAVRYHSLVVSEDGRVRNELTVTARSSDDNCIMGLRHPTRLIESVQFHPESVYTSVGQTLLSNFVASIAECDVAKEARPA